MMDKLKELFELCKASVTVNYNQHKDFYQSVESYLNAQERYNDDPMIPDAIIRKEMIERNQMVCIQAYPNTPIGFYLVYHWDLDTAIDEMLEAIKKGE